MGRSGGKTTSAPRRRTRVAPYFQGLVDEHWDGVLPPTRARRAAPGTVMFHTTLTEKRANQILEEGLIPFNSGLGWDEVRQKWAPSVYFFEDERDALRHPSHVHDVNSNWQVLAVDVGGLMLRPDPFQKSTYGRCWRVEETVSPTRLLGLAYHRHNLYIEKRKLRAAPSLQSV